MIRYYSFPQRSERWYTYRKDKWTGSTAIDLLKGKPYPSENDGKYDNRHMLRGRVLEKLAIEAYEHKYETKVSHYGFVTNSKYPHAGYSPDGVEPNILLEVKCLKLEKHNAIVTGELAIPTDYQAQIQFGLLITGLPKARLLLYNPDSDTPLFVIDVEADLGIQANLINKLEATKPKARPSLERARRKYIQNNPLKIKETRRKQYLKHKSSS